MVESVKVKRGRSVFSVETVEKGTAIPDFIFRRTLSRISLLARIDEKMWVDNSPSLKRGDSPTYTPGGFTAFSGKRPIWKRTRRFT